MLLRNSFFILVLLISLNSTVLKADVLCEAGGNIEIFSGRSTCPATHNKIELANFITGTQSIAPKGARGKKGTKGDVGADGPNGLAGAKGATGKKGLTGPKGDTGPAGAKGDRGDPGLKGVKGEKGDKGDTGPIGPKGDQGSGPEGPRGDAGSAGPKGITGAVGLEGPVGPAGDGVSFQSLSIATSKCSIERGPLAGERPGFGTAFTKTVDLLCPANRFLVNYSLTARTVANTNNYSTPLKAPVVTFKKTASTAAGVTLYSGITANFTRSLVSAPSTYEDVLYYYSLICCLGTI